MCGIAGFMSSGILEPQALVQLRAMIGTIAHRGPDDEGTWIDTGAGVALGHRRLSIVDLSAAGHQPMVSKSGRYILIYNGEIYNHTDLRTELELSAAAPPWLGHSDTEVLLAAMEHWGVRGTLERLNGMFAFALWDRQARVLTLARDRLGEKPLYYGRMRGTFLFGSELKALTCHQSFERDVDRQALTLFLRYNYIPAPHTIWRGMAKLRPGHFVEVSANGRNVGEPTPYWNLRAAIAADPLPDAPARLEELEALLRDAVGRRMEADVPLGAFLSGGVDSSLIVSLMQAQSTRPVRTFTIGFNDPSGNEAEHAKAVARHLGTDHTELYVTADHALALIPRLPTIWDEPFADSSQIPTYLVSELTRRHVTVALSGDGGDEVFGGYNRYFLAARLSRLAKRLGPSGRRLAACAARSPHGRAILAGAMQVVPHRYRVLGMFDRLPKVAHAMEAADEDDLYLRLISQVQEPKALVIGGSESGGVDMPNLADFAARMMYADTLAYLPDDILVKVDRASMAVSLETRVPFLDHRVVEYAWRLPMSSKVRGGRGKMILRELLDRYLPRELVERPKAGFGVPMGAWLKGPLREWAETLLNESQLREDGFLNAPAVRAIWEEQCRAGRQPHLVWTLLMFQAWLRAQHGALPLGSAPPLQVANA